MPRTTMAPRPARIDSREPGLLLGPAPEVIRVPVPAWDADVPERHGRFPPASPGVLIATWLCGSPAFSTDFAA